MESRLVINRYERTLEERRNKYLEVKAMLDAQVAEHSEQKTREAEGHMQEVTAQRQVWESELAAEKARAQAETLSQQETLAEMQRLNRSAHSVIVWSLQIPITIPLNLSLWNETAQD